MPFNSPIPSVFSRFVDLETGYVTRDWYLYLANLFVQSAEFTPSLVSSGGGVPTYTVQVGTYSKVSDRLLFSINIQLATLGTLAAGNITIEGLPYLSEGTTGNDSAFSVVCNSLGATATPSIQAGLAPGSTVIYLGRYAAGAFNVLTVGDLSGTSDITISGQYEIS